MDLNQALHYLQLLSHDTYTFQYLRKGKPAGHLVASYDELSETLLTLEKEHKEGKEIFLMVNEGDGITKPGKKIPRSQENVIALNTCFIDTDGAPASEVTAFLKGQRIKPHLIVETSPRKYHYYIFLNRIELHLLTDNQKYAHVQRWKAVQRCLAHLGHPEAQTDIGAQNDQARVLRVPWFSHLKTPALPFLSRIVREYAHTPYYLDELEELLGLHHLPQDLHSPGQGGQSPNQPHTHYQLSEARVQPGNRHGEIAGLLGSLLNKGVSDEIALLACYKYVEDKFDSPQDFLPGGKRHHEVTDLITYIHKQIDAQEELNRHAEAVQVLEQEPLSDPFALPTEFYTSTQPSLTTDITAHLTSNARYPAPPLYFAAALSFLGTLKSKHYRSSFGHAPSNYFLCLAPSGSGKNYAQEVLSHTAHKLSTQSLIRSGIRSDKGIARFLESTDGKGLLVLDEAEGFFASLTDSAKTPHYLLACKSLLLELYTSTNTPYKHLGEVGDTKQKPIVLSYPQINLLFHGVTHVLNSAFSNKSIQDGLLQRFIILTHFEPRTFNPNATPASALPDELLNQLEEIIIKCKFSTEKEYHLFQNLKAELTSITSNSAQDKLDRERISNELSEITANQVHRQHTISFSREAAATYDAFRQEMDDRANRETERLSGREGLFTRAAEQVGRLATVMADKRIDSSLIEYLVTFVRSRVDAVDEVSKTSHAREFTSDNVYTSVEELVKFVAFKVSDNKGRPVTKRDIYKGFKVRDSNRLDKLIQTAVELGRLQQHSTRKGKRGRPGTAFSAVFDA